MIPSELPLALNFVVQVLLLPEGLHGQREAFLSSTFCLPLSRVLLSDLCLPALLQL